jgi:hypothetical protein
MASRLRDRKPKPTPPHIRDLLAPDARVICVEGFQPYMGSPVERGRFYTLDAPVVRGFPAYFAVCIPVSDLLLDEIER